MTGLEYSIKFSFLIIFSGRELGGWGKDLSFVILTSNIDSKWPKFREFSAVQTSEYQVSEELCRVSTDFIIKVLDSVRGSQNVADPMGLFLAFRCVFKCSIIELASWRLPNFVTLVGPRQTPFRSI